MMEPSTLQVNQNDLPLVRRRRGSDTYCWICHTSIHLKDDYLCNRCGRSFHYFCNEQSKEALPPAFSNYELNSRLPCCPVCQHTNDAAFQYAPSELPELNKALSYVCEQLKKIENSNYFLYPVDEKVYPKYREVIVNPMALKFLEMKANSAGFTSAEEFLYDFKLIQHNAIVFNGKRCKISEFANKLYEIGFTEYCKISYCYQCYLKLLVDGTTVYYGDQFLNACNRPHGFVWAQKPNQTPPALYVPAKIINVRVRQEAKNLPIIDVCVFGSREIITSLKMDQCYTLSNISPNTGTRAVAEDPLKSDLAKYISSVNEIVANNPSCPIKFELVENVKNITKLTMDRLYLVKKVKATRFRIEPIEDVSAKNTIRCQNVTSAPSSSRQPSTSISKVKRTNSSKANNKKRLAQAPTTLNSNALPFKIAFDPLKYQQFLPLGFFSKTVSVTLVPSNNISVAIQQGSECSSTKFSVTSPHAKAESPQVNIIDSIITSHKRSKTLCDDINISTNDFSMIKENQEKASKRIKVVSESSESEEILQGLAGKYCRFCYQTTTPNELCCKDVYYCSNVCKKSDWKRHYPSCLQKAVKQEPQDD